MLDFFFQMWESLEEIKWEESNSDKEIVHGLRGIT